jgi:hypothetical protein
MRNYDNINKLRALGFKTYEINERIMIARGTKNTYLYKDGERVYGFIEDLGLSEETLRNLELVVCRNNGGIYIKNVTAGKYTGMLVSIFIDSSDNILITPFFYEDKNRWIATTMDSLLYYNKITGYKNRIKPMYLERFGEEVARAFRRKTEFDIIDNKNIRLQHIWLDLEREECLTGVDYIYFEGCIGMTYSIPSSIKKLWVDWIYIPKHGLYKVLSVDEKSGSADVEIYYLDNDIKRKIRTQTTMKAYFDINNENIIKKVTLWQDGIYRNHKGETCEEIAKWV